jgi:hypothetical protein
MPSPSSPSSPSSWPSCSSASCRAHTGNKGNFKWRFRVSEGERGRGLRAEMRHSPPLPTNKTQASM